MLLRQALNSTGLPDESENVTVYHWGTFYNPAKILRLAFHDCVKYKDGSGGCDGCLNWKGVGTFFKDKPGEQLYDDVRELLLNIINMGIIFLDLLFLRGIIFDN